MPERTFKVALFDYDGVIADSAGVRVEGFVEIFSSEPPDIRLAIRRYTARHGGESRFAKFRHIYEKILGRPLPPELLEQLCARYAKLVVEKAMQAPFVCGARELITAIHRNTDCYVVSGVPQAEVRELVRARGMLGMFKDVLGSPTPKATLTADIIRRYGRCDDIVFIGDTVTDCEAAQSAGIAFLGVASRNDQGELPPGLEKTADLMTYRSYFPL